MPQSARLVLISSFTSLNTGRRGEDPIAVARKKATVFSGVGKKNTRPPTVALSVSHAIILEDDAAYSDGVWREGLTPPPPSSADHRWFVGDAVLSRQV